MAIPPSSQLSTLHVYFGDYRCEFIPGTDPGFPLGGFICINASENLNHAHFRVYLPAVRASYNSYTNLWISNLCQHGSKNLKAQFYWLVSLISPGKALLIKNQCWGKPDNHRMLSLRHPGGFVWTPQTPTHTSLQSSKQCMNNNYYHDV